MGNRMPEWLKPRCPWSVAQRLGTTTARSRLSAEDWSRIGRIASAASLAAKTPERLAADCAKARAGYALKLWRSAGYTVSVAPMPYIWFCILRSVRDVPGTHCRRICTGLGLQQRSVDNAAAALRRDRYIEDCPAVFQGRGARRGFRATESGLVVLAKAEEAINE